MNWRSGTFAKVLFGAKNRPFYITPDRVLTIGWAIASAQALLLVMLLAQPGQMQAQPGVLWTRILLIAAGWALAWQVKRPFLPEKYTIPLLYAVLWLGLPMTTLYNYFATGYERFWLGSVCFTVIVYVFVLPWRQVVWGYLSGAIAAVALQLALSTQMPEPPMLHVAIMAMTLVIGIGYSVHSVDFRDMRIQATLSTVNHIQHAVAMPLQSARRCLTQMPSALTLAVSDAKQASVIEDAVEQVKKSIRTALSHLYAQQRNAQMSSVGESQQCLSALELMRSVVSAWHHMQPDPGIAIEWEQAQDFVFKGNRIEWEQALHNLLGNACQAVTAAHGSQHTGKIVLSVYDKLPHGYGFIELQDNGTGIAARDQPHVFDPFYVANGNSALGLGLTYAQEVVASSRGSIMFHSLPGAGSRFTIRLPV